MKKKLFFIGTLCNGGAERVVSILSSQMARQEMDVEILTYYDRPVSYEIDERVKLSSVEKLSGKKGKLGNLFWLRRYFKENAEVVISFLAPFNILAIAANLGSKVPIIVADRNDPERVPSNPVLRKIRDILYRFASGVVVQTKKNQSYFSKTVQKKSRVIYNPVDLKENAGAAIGTKKEKTIVTAGRLMPQKNQTMLIRAFASVLMKYPDYRLVIYGDGPERENLEQLAGELSVSGQVIFPGNVSDLHEQMKTAKMFVLCSDYEGMPNALIEAMCLGLPCISTEVSGATDLIKDHRNGLLIRKDDQQALEEAMLEVIGQPGVAERLSKEAVLLNEKLKVNKIMDQWIAWIREMMEK